MDLFANLQLGFQVALSLQNLLYCFLGCFLGTMIGVLPGIGPSAAIALLLPLTYGASPTGAIIMFAGLYYGAQYGGTLTSVLINVPGESTSVMTTLDGYQMALQGRGGVALGIAATGSFIAGVIGTLGLIVFIRGLTIEGDPPRPTHWRPLLWILASVVLFGFLVQPAGIIIASVVLVLVCAYGGHEFSWKEELIEAAILAAAVVAIFSWGLGLPFKLWPWSF